MTSKWRYLIDDKTRPRQGNNKLYDITQDPSQKNNIANSHPKVVKKLRDAYNKWWNDLNLDSIKVSDFTVIVGSKYENPSTLTSHDLRGFKAGYPWHQSQVAEAKYKAKGYWEVNFAKKW